MPSETITETYQAAGVIPAAPWRLRALSVLPEWQLEVTFNDERTKGTDLFRLFAICGWILLPLSGKRNVCFVQNQVGITCVVAATYLPEQTN